MGADIYTYGPGGTELAYFRDSYNQSSLFGIINETLKLKEGDAGFMSWWQAVRKEDEDENGKMKVAAIQLLHDRLTERLIEMMNTPVWKRGYGSGAPLDDYEKVEELNRLTELLRQLRLGLYPGNTMIWSV